MPDGAQMPRLVVSLAQMPDGAQMLPRLAVAGFPFSYWVRLRCRTGLRCLGLRSHLLRCRTGLRCYRDSQLPVFPISYVSDWAFALSLRVPFSFFVPSSLSLGDWGLAWTRVRNGSHTRMSAVWGSLRIQLVFSLSRFQRTRISGRSRIKDADREQCFCDEQRIGGGLM
jgi:hypothetical protein